MIYYLYDPLNNAVKIGYAKKVISRLVNYYTHNLNPLLLVKIENGDKKKEKETHKLFHYLQIRTEWFKCADKLKQTLCEFYGSDFTQFFNYYDYKEKNNKFLVQNNLEKSLYISLPESTKQKIKLRKKEKLKHIQVKCEQSLDELFAKCKNSYIIAKDIPNYLEKNGIKNLTGGKTIPVTKIAKYFGVKIQSKRVEGEVLRCITGLTYKKEAYIQFVDKQNKNEN